LLLLLLCFVVVFMFLLFLLFAKASSRAGGDFEPLPEQVRDDRRQPVRSGTICGPNLKKQTLRNQVFTSHAIGLLKPGAFKLRVPRDFVVVHATPKTGERQLKVPCLT
jgi:hypothetical protein